jgi:hypothetical protein
VVNTTSKRFKLKYIVFGNKNMEKIETKRKTIIIVGWLGIFYDINITHLI